MDELNLLNRVFSHKTLSELLSNGESEILEQATKRYLGTDDLDSQEKFAQLYSILSKHYRNEYFYKNTLINKVLLGKHSLNTTTALSEIWLNRSKADLILLNRQAVVYEIKTELDNLERLEGQLSDYYQVFDRVMIITDESHLEKVLDRYQGSSVGISIISKRNTIRCLQEAKQNSAYLEHRSMYKILRKEERRRVLERFYPELPQVDQFAEFECYYELFAKIPCESLNQQLIVELKKRDQKVIQNQSEFSKVPTELKALLYFKPLKKEEYVKLAAVMKEG